MSQENVEIARQANAAFNSGDPDAFLEFFAAEIELVDLASAPDQQTAVKGKDAIREALRLWTAAFDDLQVDIAEYTDAGDAVICAAHWHGQGKASGISIDVRQFDLYEFHDGKGVRTTLGYKTKDEALEAAGSAGPPSG
jgi:ketosteroid isomerase-like protein